MYSIVLAMAVIGQPQPSLASESAAAKADWATLSAEEQVYTRYMTTFAAQLGFFGPPPEKVLSFWVNSLSSKGVIKPPRRVTATLYSVDLRDYAWRIEDWSVVTSRDPYLGLKNGLMVRADWFVWHTSNTEDSDSAYLLLYQGKPPRNVTEFHARWGVRLADIRKFEAERGAYVAKGASIVALNDRVLAWGYGVHGLSFYSFDTIASAGRRRIPNNLSGFKFDAQELITPLSNGLHTYLLANGQGNRVEFADPRIAIDHTDSRRPIVRNMRSCVVCHGRVSGLHPPRNFVDEYLDKASPVIGIDSYRKEVQQFIERFYTTDSGKRLRFAQSEYAEAIATCNGLEPADNANAYQRLLEEYEANLTQQQAATELGISVETLKQAAALRLVDPESPQVDVALLGSDNPGTVPRESWEQDGYHQFVERLNILHGGK